MSDHRVPDVRIKDITEHGDDREQRKQTDIEHEEDDRQIIQPDAIIGQDVEKLAHDACPHRNGEPSANAKQPLSVQLSFNNHNKELTTA